jgi:hypothetical protein
MNAVDHGLNCLAFLFPEKSEFPLSSGKEFDLLVNVVNCLELLLIRREMHRRVAKIFVAFQDELGHLGQPCPRGLWTSDLGVSPSDCVIAFDKRLQRHSMLKRVCALPLKFNHTVHFAVVLMDPFLFVCNLTKMDLTLYQQYDTA